MRSISSSGVRVGSAPGDYSNLGGIFVLPTNDINSLGPGSYLTTMETARLLKKAPGTLQNWRSKGNGPPYVKVGASVRYRVADLIAWLEFNTVFEKSERLSRPLDQTDF